MSTVKDGDTVKVHYTGKLEDDTVFDSSEGRDPLSFKIGAGNVIPGFENGVTGMAVGDKKTVTIPVDEAYGPRREEMMAKVEKSKFPDDIVPEIGQKLQMQQPDNSVVNVEIVDVQDDEVTLDANHPLAGKVLIFDLELVEIA
ncbi:MAG: peptidylprolyl isomerase [candidate division Zixibacteria bacterium]|nr:peptidylprolyl isomerase [candidate division Zixibacteria bacterium]